MANITNSQYLLFENPFDGLQAKDGANIVKDIQAIITSAGDLAADGSVVGATGQPQEFTNGTILANLTANTIVMADATKLLISATGDLTTNAGNYLVVNGTEDGLDMIPFAGLLADGSIVGATASIQQFTLGVQTNIINDDGDDIVILQSVGTKGIQLVAGAAALEVSALGDVISASATNGLSSTKFTSSLYQDIGAAMVVEQSTANNLTVINTLAGGQLQLTSTGNTRLLTTSISFGLIEGTTTIAANAASGMTVQSTNGVITLTPDTGWTASVGTANKAGIDSDDAIYTAGALQNLARTVVAIQNTLMTKGFFVA